jgi:hypothetical protein
MIVYILTPCHHRRDPFSQNLPPNAEHRRAINPSEGVLQDLQKLRKMNAKIVRYLIQDVLNNPIFNPANVQVDHNKHDRLMWAVMDDMDVHYMKMKSDGKQDVKFFKHKMVAVLQEQLAYERLEGC